MNLAHNAVQQTAADDTIAIGASLREDTVRIWVRDTGAGVSGPTRRSSSTASREARMRIGSTLGAGSGWRS